MCRWRHRHVGHFSKGAEPSLAYPNKKAVLSQGEPRDAFWDNLKVKSRRGLYIPNNNAGFISKVSEAIATENVLSIIFFDYIDNFAHFFSLLFLVLSLIN